MTRGRRPVPLAGLLAVVAALLGGAVPVPAVRVGQARAVTVLQMNLCLSGLGGCYGRASYPAVVEEAIDRIRDEDADAVVLDEACSGDAQRIAAATGLHRTFSTVIYAGAPLTCRDPRGRGVFGNAVLTRQPPLAVRDTAYARQADPEERRLACVLTRGLTVCATHLSASRSAQDRAANDAQCAELRMLLARPVGPPPTVSSGDMNRRPGCAPRGWRTLTDADAGQSPGLQHVYLDPRLDPIAWQVRPMTHSDHDALVVRFTVESAPG